MANILVIDDDLAIRYIACSVLRRAGHLVIEAENSTAALDQLMQGQFDLVLTDILMPGGDGIEGILKIRQARPSVRIVAMSGSGSGSLYLDAASKLGADATLNKPFRPEQLSQIVARVLVEPKRETRGSVEQA